MSNIEKAIAWEQHNLNVDPNEKMRFFIEMNNVFKDLLKDDNLSKLIDTNINKFNSSFTKDAIIEGLSLTKLNLNIEIKNNNKNIRYANEIKEYFNKFLEASLERIDSAIIKIKEIRSLYKK